MFFSIHLSQDPSKLSAYISGTLLEEMEKTLKKGEKVLLYLNKRGAHSCLICEDCQHLFECPNCDVSLSVHHTPRQLLCHLCQQSFPLPIECPNCHGSKLKSVGIGTQQVEALMKESFQDKRIFRFDSDVMKTLWEKKNALENIENADIIIGTKMITTGFDFEKIGLIGVILIEQELSLASYNAHEKAYQNLRQLSGRGNRKLQKTHILLQSFIPKHPLIISLIEENYKDFLVRTLEERKTYLYPPFDEFVTLEYRHPDKQKALEYTKNLEKVLQELDTQNREILAGSSSFRKNNQHHSVCIIKGKNIRELLEHIRPQILRESRLSVLFSESF